VRILVVDDDTMVIASCRRILEADGFDVTAVQSADEAIEIVRKNDFDLMLFDVKMPKHDGPFLIREIRKDFPRIPIVAMSGYPTQETSTDVMRAGAARFIPKPFRPDDLARTVRDVLGFKSDP